MSAPHFTITSGADLTPADLAQCAQFFSEHYGHWSPHPDVDERLRTYPSPLRAAPAHRPPASQGAARSA